jgi:hypothetical protein
LSRLARRRGIGHMKWTQAVATAGGVRSPDGTWHTRLKHGIARQTQRQRVRSENR